MPKPTLSSPERPPVQFAIPVTIAMATTRPVQARQSRGANDSATTASPAAGHQAATGPSLGDQRTEQKAVT
ncbi:unannotated protein [freshwater metagenome]|uniref:Unannotated protein n=1 Tax=freshwater metagenome TaxID=449393 RepID=A0A6J6S748_9ZZZZ